MVQLLNSQTVFSGNLEFDYDTANSTLMGLLSEPKAHFYTLL